MNTGEALKSVRPGLAIAIATLLFGIGMGILFGVNEDGVKGWINAGIAAHPELHDAKSADKIWRYAQRAHFHATGIGAFTLALIAVLSLSAMKKRLKKISAILIGLGGLYPMAWFSMFLLSPSMGRGAAHYALITELFVYVSIGGLLSGMGIFMASVFFGLCEESCRSD